MTTVIVPKFQDITVHVEGTRVQVISNGQVVIDVPWEIARGLSKALFTQAGKAEEIAKREQIVFDSAILARVGAPLLLTEQPDLVKEIKKEAAWNSKLRRYLPGGVKSKEIFGIPSVIKEKKP